MGVGRRFVSGKRASRLEVWRRAWREAPSRRRALRYFLEYAAVRVWATVIGCFPIETNLRTARWMGRIWWWLKPAHRQRALDNLRPSLGDEYDERQLRSIALGAFEHFAQLYLVELVMTPRLVTIWSWPRYIALGDIREPLRELLAPHGVIMITPHFGNFELLGFTLAKLGLPLTAIMRPLDDPLINDYLIASRAASGLELLLKHGVSERADAVIGGGGTLCFIADQDAGRKGVFSDFFGRKASWYKSIGLLAMRRNAPIIVGYAARRRRGFRYDVHVERIIRPEEWAERDAPLQWITDEYAAAMERCIRRHPEQYLWMHRRWKSRPRNERGPAANV
ncbi:MAG: hypothetical protein D6744_11880 [Planctomycetota bacterium]|nr:MAG: hypothetical protein D6744_11880 [Planctomycetota bacterium]